MGSALGPDWKTRIDLKGANLQCNEDSHLHIEYSCEVKQIFNSLVEVQSYSRTSGSSQESFGDWPVYAELTNGKIFGADIILSATGVIPNTEFLVVPHSLDYSSDGGILVDTNMRTNIKDVYAAGDVCHVRWNQSREWFQMRLWTQARQMGIFTGRCLVSNSSDEDILLDFCFELFAHMTSFFGYKVCLLGCYNGQGLDNDFEILVRKTDNVEYVKAVCINGRVVGALLIGETDLEETFENLILNKIDISRFGESLLDPCIDIEDYFD